MMTQKELEKMQEKPLPEVKRRIKAALSGEVTAQEIIVEQCAYNGFHSINGKMNIEGKYIFTFSIAKAI